MRVHGDGLARVLLGHVLHHLVVGVGVAMAVQGGVSCVWVGESSLAHAQRCCVLLPVVWMRVPLIWQVRRGAQLWPLAREGSSAMHTRQLAVCGLQTARVLKHGLHERPKRCKPGPFGANVTSVPSTSPLSKPAPAGAAAAGATRRSPPARTAAPAAEQQQAVPLVYVPV